MRCNQAIGAISSVIVMAFLSFNVKSLTLRPCYNWMDTNLDFRTDLSRYSTRHSFSCSHIGDGVDEQSRRWGLF